ncbi:hypothetical protein A0256_03655 [Mucilaginibacter sp. PAMC 26640]|nr:hypothetical protein A0256_03655 [Mucilaginibacter sp. PAMC 26640]
MQIEDILAKVLNGSPRDFYSFETFILNLLKFHIESQGKTLSIINTVRRIGDAVADDGFDSFQGKTLIEIKYNTQVLTSVYSLELFFNKLITSKSIVDLNEILIISFKPISLTLAKKLSAELFNDKSVKITIWGLEDINKIVNKHKKKATEISDNLFSLRLENAVTKEINWEEERDEKIQLLQEVYEKGQFSFFLGAGVSSSAGMPDWNTLLNSLFVSYLTKEFDKQVDVTDEDIKQIVSRLNKIDEPSALMAARYLRKGLSHQASEIREFTKTITNNLYKLRDNTKKINSDLLTTITDLCMPKRTGAKVRSVVTYNFDDLLERQLESKTIMHRSIYNENENLDPDELPVYHVHGFLPEDASSYENLDKSTLVFSEEGYHQIYTDAYHWSNLVQLTNLRENNCLMVGLSLTDPNLRRLLDIAARNIARPRHFALLRRMSIEMFAYTKDETGNSIQVIENMKGAEDFLNRHHKLNEEIMKELGVSIIWFKSFEEIPEILKKLS